MLNNVESETRDQLRTQVDLEFQEKLAAKKVKEAQSGKETGLEKATRKKNAKMETQGGPLRLVSDLLERSEPLSSLLGSEHHGSLMHPSGFQQQMNGEQQSQQQYFIPALYQMQQQYQQQQQLQYQQQQQQQMQFQQQHQIEQYHEQHQLHQQMHMQQQQMHLHQHNPSSSVAAQSSHGQLTGMIHGKTELAIDEPSSKAIEERDDEASV